MVALGATRHRESKELAVNVEWSGAASSASAWDGFSLVIDTTKFAGEFEREMLAACFGVLSAYPTGGAKEAAAAYDGPDMSNAVAYVLNDPGDDAISYDRVTIYPTPGWSNDGRGNHSRLADGEVAAFPAYQSVRIPLARSLTAEELAGVRRRAEAFAAREGFVVEGYRYIRERDEVQSVDACAAVLTTPETHPALERWQRVADRTDHLATGGECTLRPGEVDAAIAEAEAVLAKYEQPMTTMTLTTVLTAAFCVASVLFTVISAVLRLEAHLRRVENSVADAMQHAREDRLAARKAESKSRAVMEARAPYRSCGCGCHGGK